ncbi:MAG: sulfotransferase family protein [bacterium]
MKDQALIQPLPALPSMFQQQLSHDLQYCLKHATQASDPVFHKTTDQNDKLFIVFLISVGGFTNQDLPMSGCLAANPLLNKCPALFSLLGAIGAPLARVCLIKSESGKTLGITSTSVSSLLDIIYCNPSHHLFYQTHLLQCDGQYILRIETQRPEPLMQSQNQTYAQRNKTLLWQEPHLEKIRQLLNQQIPIVDSLNLVKPALTVLSPRQLDATLSPIKHICQKIDNNSNEVLLTDISQFQQQWQIAYNKFAQHYTGEWTYQAALNHFRNLLVPKFQQLLKKIDPVSQKIYDITQDEKQQIKLDIKLAIDTISQQLTFSPPAPRRINRQTLLKARRRKQFKVNHLNLADIPHYDRPLFIVSAPRAGSTLLFETLSKFPELWSTGEENHELIENIAGLHPRDQQFHSNRLTAAQANSTTREAVLKAFSSRLQDRSQTYYLALEKTQQPSAIRFLEKTPKNALRIPFLKTVFPDAKFIYLHRDYAANVSSLIDGWRSQRFIAYRDLPHLPPHQYWSFLLTPHWQTLLNDSLATIAQQQWEVSNRIIQQDLAPLSSDDWIRIDYQTLIKHPLQVVQTVATFADLITDEPLLTHCRNGLPISRLTLSTPNQKKWEKHRCFLMEKKQ